MIQKERNKEERKEKSIEITRDKKREKRFKGKEV